MSAWSDGYVTDIPYTHSFFRELSPTFLNYCALLHGVEPPETKEGFSYLELGCGHGVSTNMLAAVHPEGQFYGVDFMPAHVLFASKLAGQAKQDNVHFLERSFEDIAAGMEALPQFDYITFHGIYSWISEANRHCLVEIVRRYLKPGGLVYCSYNAMPGWAGMAPVQWLLESLSHGYAGNSLEAAQQALGFVAEMQDVDFGYFKANKDALEKRLNKLKHHKPAYVVHEYLNASWHPLYFKQVMTEMAGGKLDFVGQATPVTAFPRLSFPAKALALAEKVDDPTLRETVLDFLSNNQFRRDIFSKSATRLALPAATNLLMEIAFLPTSVFNKQVYEKQNQVFHSVIGLEYFREIGKWIVKSPLRGPDLARFAGSQKLRPRDLVRVLALLVQSNLIAPCSQADQAAATASARRMNRAAPYLNVGEAAVGHVASAAIGTALPNENRLVRQVISLLIDGCEADPAVLADQLVEKFSIQLRQDGKPLSPEVNRTRLMERVKNGLAAIGTWRRLGVN